MTSGCGRRSWAVSCCQARAGSVRSRVVRDELVGGEGQELLEAGSEGEAHEQVAGLVELAAGEARLPTSSSMRFISSETVRWKRSRGDGGAVLERGGVVDPLPDLCARRSRRSRRPPSGRRSARSRWPRSQASRYWTPTRMLWRRPASVRLPLCGRRADPSRRYRRLRARRLSSWFGLRHVRVEDLAARSGRGRGARPRCRRGRPSTSRELVGAHLGERLRRSPRDRS